MSVFAAPALTLLGGIGGGFDPTPIVEPIVIAPWVPGNWAKQMMGVKSVIWYIVMGAVIVACILVTVHIVRRYILKR